MIEQMPNGDRFEKTERTTVHRLPARAAYERDTVYSILDEGLICHVGYTGSDGVPYVMPVAYGRAEDQFYLHGSAISRTMDRLAEGVTVCVTVTLVDAMVLARSAFHHSMNYRSVMIFGTALPITDPAEKLAALAAITNHLLPGRWEEVRETTSAELNATSVLRLPIEEVSAKIRTGGPKDGAEDLSLPIWSGVVPLGLTTGTPNVASDNLTGARLPDSVGKFIGVHARDARD